MKEANTDKFKRKKMGDDDLLMVDGTMKEGNKDKYKRKSNFNEK